MRCSKKAQPTSSLSPPPPLPPPPPPDGGGGGSGADGGGGDAGGDGGGGDAGGDGGGCSRCEHREVWCRQPLPAMQFPHDTASQTFWRLRLVPFLAPFFLTPLPRGFDCTPVKRVAPPLHRS